MKAKKTKHVIWRARFDEEGQLHVESIPTYSVPGSRTRVRATLSAELKIVVVIDIGSEEVAWTRRKAIETALEKERMIHADNETRFTRSRKDIESGRQRLVAIEAYAAAAICGKAKVT